MARNDDPYSNAQEPDGPKEHKLRKISRDELKRIVAEHEKWVESNGEKGTRADLSKTDLREAILEDTNLQRADLSNADLQDANLEGAILAGAELQGTNLKGANLRNADLTEAKSLLVRQLAGLDLTGAKIPEDINNFEGPLNVVEEASRNSRNIFFLMLSANAYVLLSAATMKDKTLILNDTSSTLPIIGTSMPIAYFYMASPVLLLALYAYFHLYLLRLFENMADLPAVFPDGHPLHKKAYPWLIGGLVCANVARLKNDRPVLSGLQVFFSIILGWGFVPFTLLFIWGRYMPMHDWRVTVYHEIAVSMSIALAFFFYLIAIQTLKGNDPRIMLKPVSGIDMPTCYKKPTFFAVMVFLLMVYTYTVGGLPNAGANWLVNANIVEDALSVKPDNWTGKRPAELDSVKGAWLRRVHLENANAFGAFIAKGDLMFAHLEGAKLNHAHLEGADLRWAHLDGANLMGAHLQGAVLRLTPLKEINMEVAELDKADLSDAHLEKADLMGARLQGANLEQAHLDGAFLGDSKLEGARLRKADIRGALLSSAAFGTYSTECGPRLTDIRFANLSGVIGLEQSQLENAMGNHETILPAGYTYPAHWE